jgi:hypothetical protein
MERKNAPAMLIAAVLCAIAPAAAWAAEYYADSSGSDSNPGTESQPWAHCPGMEGWAGSAALEPGDVVYLSSSGTWTAGDTASLLEPVGGVTYDGSSWGGGTRAVLRATGELGRAVVAFREDHPTLPTVVRGFEVDGGDQLTAGVIFDWGYAPAELTGAVKRVEDCVVHDFYSRAAEGSWKYGIVISAWGGETLSNVEVIGCTVYNTPRSAVVNYVGNDDTTNRSENVVIRGCDIYGAGEDPDSDGHGIALKNHVISALVEYNTIHDVAGGGIHLTNHDEAGFMGPENAVIRYNIITNTGGRSSGAGVRISEMGDRSADIYGNLMAGNGNSGISISWQVGGAMTVRIYNNTLVRNCQSAGDREILVQSNTADIRALEITNNILFSSDTISSIIDEDGSISAHFNNLYFRAGGGRLVSSAGTSYEAAAITDWEPTALAADPLLEDPAAVPTGFVGEIGVNARPNTEGLGIREDSPARDSAMALDAAYGGSINSVVRPEGAGWDRGAYEYGELTPCESLGGTCCEPGQVCEGGVMSGSSDCGPLCCVGGACADAPEPPEDDITPADDPGPEGLTEPSTDATADTVPQDGGEDGEGEAGDEGCGCRMVY